MKNRFTKPPLNELEKEKRAEEFLNFHTEKDSLRKTQELYNTNDRVLKKESVKAFLLRFPMSTAQNIIEISALTGLSRNAVCVDLLRSASREKLKELKSQL